MLTSESSMVWLKKNTEISLKTYNSYLNPDAPQFLPFEHATGDHSKQLRLCLYMAQNYQYNTTMEHPNKGAVTKLGVKK